MSLLGNDLTGDGSAANPYGTVQRAINQADLAADGADTINIAGGLYNQAGVDLNLGIREQREHHGVEPVGRLEQRLHGPRPGRHAHAGPWSIAVTRSRCGL